VHPVQPAASDGLSPQTAESAVVARIGTRLKERNRMTDRNASAVSVERLMHEIENDLRGERRRRVLARGGPAEYRDSEIFAAVEGVLRRAVERRDRDAALLPVLLDDDEDWQLQAYLRFSSHRRLIGPAIVFFKRRLLLPVMRWLYEYSLENFRRQERVNQVLFACLEELAIENARLQQLVKEQSGPR
jgi:hypothetical protein